MSDRPEPRIGDREREAAVGALGEHFAAGRITQDEFEERSTRAWAARTSSELWPLFADLPTGAEIAAWQSGRAAAPASPVGADGTAPARRGQGRSSGRSFPLVPLLVLLAVLLVVTRIPFFLGLLVVAALWFSISRHSSAHPAWSRHHRPHGRRW